VQSPDNLQLVKTADGSNTIYNAQVGENYHSKHGALQESRHVFVNAWLLYYLNMLKGSPTGADLDEASVSILEVGFGTGLNFLLTADVCANQNINLNYTGIEAYPLTPGLISQTGYDEYVSAGIWNSFTDNYNAAFQTHVKLTETCTLQIAGCKLRDFQATQQYDIIYFDAFASANQPEMWDEAAISHTIQFLKPGGIFVTYAITGNLKRTLKALGCRVEKAPGAPGKREMLRAHR
jgi:tRNA U34 5-methylaminomethyl-2-thiouridine-forming methyltransferase MnmC